MATMATMTGLHWAAGESCISPLGIFANVLLPLGMHCQESTFSKTISGFGAHPNW